MPLDFTPVSHITPAIEPCKIKVRVVRLWGFPKKDKPNEFTGIDMLLVDDKRGRIQASIKGNLLSKFRKQLEEGECYVLMNFELGPNLGQFRSSAHPYKINFIFYTCVKPCEQIPNLESRFNFCPFPEIIAKTNVADIFIDIIGEIIGMNEVKDITTSVDGPTKILNLRLKDLGDSVVDVAIWGKLADDIHSQIESQTSAPVIFLGSLMKTSIFKGKATVQSSNFATKIMINTPLPEIIEFQIALCNGEPNTLLAITEIESSNFVQTSKTDFSLSDKKTISQLRELDMGTIGNVHASISCIESKTSWFYIGCTVCYTKVTPYFNPDTEETEPNKFSCEKCKKQIASTQPRFKLAVRAMDTSASTSLILFDDVVIPLIRKSAYELLEQQVKFNRSDETPQELLDLNGRIYVFKLLVKESATYNRSSTYRVLSLTDDPDTVKKFADCDHILALEPEIVSVSAISAGNSTQTDNISSEAENLDNAASNVSMLTPTTKRSLPSCEIDVVQQSSTKPKLMSKSQIKKERK